MTTTLTDHPLAALIPQMSDDEYAALQNDIEERGLIEPLLTYEDRILDGRHRYRACKALDIEPKTKVYRGDDPVGHVIALNVKRRHLSASQLAFVGSDAEAAFARQAKQRMSEAGKSSAPGKPASKGVATSPPVTGKAREQAAKVTGASPRYISDAKAIEAAAPDIAQEVRKGSLNIPQAKEKIQERKAVNALADAVKRYPFLKDVPGAKPKQIIDTADALDGYTGAEKKVRLESGRKWADMMRRRALDPAKASLSDAAERAVEEVIGALVTFNLLASRALMAWDEMIEDPTMPGEWQGAIALARKHLTELEEKTKSNLRRVK
ncbi:MAG: ParB N-terminal domain-containing protein [Acidimicrobiales bacterium]